jgi:hypothetical protein
MLHEILRFEVERESLSPPALWTIRVALLPAVEGAQVRVQRPDVEAHGLVAYSGRGRICSCRGDGRDRRGRRQLLRENDHERAWIVALVESVASCSS